MLKGVNFLDATDDEDSSTSDSLLNGARSPVFNSFRKTSPGRTIPETDSESDSFLTFPNKIKIKLLTSKVKHSLQSGKPKKCESQTTGWCLQSATSSNSTSLNSTSSTSTSPNGLQMSAGDGDISEVIDKRSRKPSRLKVKSSYIESSDSEFEVCEVKPPPTSSTSPYRSASSSTQSKFKKRPVKKATVTNAKKPRSSTAKEIKASTEIVLLDSDSDSIVCPADISDAEFERVIQGMEENKKNGARISNNHCTPYYDISIIASSSASSPRAASSRGVTSQICKKNLTGQKGKIRTSRHATEFVPASDISEVEPSSFETCSPSRPCRKRSCSCRKRKSGATSTTPSRPKSKRRSHSQGSAKRKSNTSITSSPGEASGTNASMTLAVEVATQMERDEELARKLQEDLDRQFALNVASSRSPMVARGRPSDVHIPIVANSIMPEDMEARVAILTDWEWQVHVSLIQGFDLPPVPPGDHRQSPDEAIDETLLSYLVGNPLAINRRNVGQNNEPTLLRPPQDSPPTRRRPTSRRGSRIRSRVRSRGYQDALAAIRQYQRLSPDEFGALLHLNIPGYRRNGLDTTFADGDNYEQLLALDDLAQEDVGLSTDQIARLPVTTFKEGTTPVSDEGKQCYICMCDYESGDQLRLLTCFHGYHCACIDEWIRKQATCPVCRTNIEV